jgi:hypothetical protein
VAWAYHYTRYASINWAATYFAYAFVLEALLLLALGVGRGLCLRAKRAAIRRSGVGLVVFALVLQPLIGPPVGRSWSQVEIFAIAPDPTVVATLGSRERVAGVAAHSDPNRVVSRERCNGMDDAFGR